MCSEPTKMQLRKFAVFYRRLYIGGGRKVRLTTIKRSVRFHKVLEQYLRKFPDFKALLPAVSIETC